MGRIARAAPFTAWAATRWRLYRGASIGSAALARMRRLAVPAALAIAAAACSPHATAPTANLSIILSANTVVGRDGTGTTGTVAFVGGSPTSSSVVTLASDNAAASTPSTVTLPAGTTTATFPITTSQVMVPTQVSVRATYQGQSVVASLTVEPIPVCGPFLSPPVAMPFLVYADSGDFHNHFIPSGFFGDIQDLTLNTSDTTNPQSGASAIRIDYVPRGPQGFAGLVWQCPENNFGTTPGAGFNLSLAHQVMFWARATTASLAEFKVGGVGYGTAAFSDSFPTTSTSPVVVALSSTWQPFTIDVSHANLSEVIGGFLFVTSATENPGGTSIFLDNITWQ